MTKTEYETNPKICKKCQEPMVFEKRRNIFCSSSCAASFNNTGKVKPDSVKAAISKSVNAYFESLNKPKKQPKIKAVSVKQPRQTQAKPKKSPKAATVNASSTAIKPKNTPIFVIADEEVKNILKLYPEYSKVYGPYLRSDGRVVVALSNGKKSVSKQIARVRLEVSLQRRLASDETVDHIDNDKTNDDLSNLQVLSSKENSAKYNRASGRYIRKDHDQICCICNKGFRLIKKRMTCGGVECKKQIRSKCRTKTKS